MKKIIMAVMVLTLVFLSACEGISGLTREETPTLTPASLKIIKTAELGPKWKMKQLSFKVGAGQEASILLRLATGDRVDGYFYLEKGERVDFRVSGKTSVYSSETQDRFSFVASEAQGDTYLLTFRNPADEDDREATVTVFLEIIYPVSGLMYVPIEGESSK